MIKGMFLSDIHMPLNIDLTPIKDFARDFKPDIFILGGDVVDAQYLHGVDNMRAEAVDVKWYKRDVALARELMSDLHKASPKAEMVYLEGNHEERYVRLANKYPKVFGDIFKFGRDIAPKNFRFKWVPYGDYSSHYIVGDTIFMHGNIWPDHHAKAYALRHLPYKVVYGHLHHFQAYTTHRALLDQSPRYALTAGCLSELSPDWKKGEAHQWVNGFVSFVSDGTTTVPTAHLIENKMFAIGGKIYR